jgi:vacuolar-type H+-ATPase subunit D/Vma8
LLTKKKADFILFKECLELLNRKEQSTIEGLLKIINIRASMNKGLSKELSKAFSNCNIAPVSRPLIQSEIIPNPY